jgi:hypothetical protein
VKTVTFAKKWSDADAILSDMVAGMILKLFYFRALIVEAEGLTKIKELQYHSNNHIRKKSISILPFLANVTVFTPFGPLDSSSSTLRIFSNPSRSDGNYLGIICSEEIAVWTNASLRNHMQLTIST